MIVEKVEKLIGTLYEKNILVHIQTLKQGLKIMHRVIRFNQNAWLKHGKWIWKIFFKLMNTEVFGKSLENIRKQR